MKFSFWGVGLTVFSFLVPASVYSQTPSRFYYFERSGAAPLLHGTVTPLPTASPSAAAPSEPASSPGRFSLGVAGMYAPSQGFGVGPIVGYNSRYFNANLGLNISPDLARGVMCNVNFTAHPGQTQQRGVLFGVGGALLCDPVGIAAIAGVGAQISFDRSHINAALGGGNMTNFDGVTRTGVAALLSYSVEGDIWLLNLLAGAVLSESNEGHGQQASAIGSVRGGVRFGSVGVEGWVQAVTDLVDPRDVRLAAGVAANVIFGPDPHPTPTPAPDAAGAQ